jgi:replicative DNA helicase
MAGGLTWLVLYHALQNWLKGKPVLVVSMEMSPLAILQRLVTMYAHTNIQQLKLGAYSSSTYKKFSESCHKLSNEKHAPLYVVDGNLAVSVEETFVLAEQLKVDMVDIDGAYLMKHHNPRLDRYTRVAENAELLKQSASSTGKPTLASYQFARSAVKDKKKKQDVGLEDIGYTDVIGQVSSVALGLFQDESVETIEGRQVRILKGRNGEVGQFSISWDFANMEFGQKQVQDDQQTGQLEYI